MALTKVSGQVVKTNTDLTVGVLTATTASFTTVSVAGTITYDDVTNVDSVGLITARSGVNITSGGLIVTGISTVSAGTTSAPSISPSGDSNTGIFFPSADTIAFSEGGVEAARIDSSGRFGIGVTPSAAKLEVAGGNIRLDNNQGVEWGGVNNYIYGNESTDFIAVATNGNERSRWDSSGRLLIGTSSAPTVGVPASATFVVQGYAGVPTGDSLISLQRGQAPASISSGTQLGGISFGANDGSPYAQIHAATDGTGGASDYPGRLVFSTTADGGSAPTERMRLDSSGRLGVGTSSPSVKCEVNGDIFASGGDIYTGPNRMLSSDSIIRPLIFGIGAVEKARLDSSGRLGIGTTSPQHLLDCTSIGRFTGNTNSAASGAGIEIGYDASNTTGFIQSYNRGSSTYLSTAVDGSDVRFKISGTERARIDSSGRLLVGTSTSVPVLSTATGAAVQVNSNSHGAYAQTWFYGANNTIGPVIMLAKSRNTTYGSFTVVQAGDNLGSIWFAGDDGSDLNQAGAKIDVEVDGTPGTNDMPGRLIFSTTADGASTPTERMRIDSVGAITWANSDAIFESINTFADARIRGTSSGCNVYVQSNGQTGVYQSGTGWVSASSARLKNVVSSVDSEQCWDFVKGVNLYRYYFKQDPQEGIPYLGPMAEEIGQLDPEMLLETNQTDEQGPIYSFNLPLMEMKAFAALQTALERIEQLEAEMAEIKAQLS